LVFCFVNGFVLQAVGHTDEFQGISHFWKEINYKADWIFSDFNLMCAVGDLKASGMQQ